MTELEAREVLGIEGVYDAASLRECYRTKVRQVHPDLALDPLGRVEAEVRLRDVIEAYDVLRSKAVSELIPEPALEVQPKPIEEDDYEIPAAIASFFVAAAIFGFAMWFVTTYVLTHGISPRTTAYSFLGLFVLWGILYGVLCPVFEENVRRKATQQQ